MGIKTTKRKALAAVIIITVILSLALISRSDALPIGDDIDYALDGGGTILTQEYAQWQLHKYKDVTLPRRAPFKYAPWTSFIMIDRYVTVGAQSNCNTLMVDAALYPIVKTEADHNKRTAKEILSEYKVNGKGRKALRKIRRYVEDGEYISGVKSASGFFEHHGGDCAAHASAVYVLCQVQGIPIRWCDGGYHGGLHAWNRVKLNSKWYWVDTTYKRKPSRSLWDGYRKPMEMW